MSVNTLRRGAMNETNAPANHTIPANQVYRPSTRTSTISSNPEKYMNISTEIYQSMNLGGSTEAHVREFRRSMSLRVTNTALSLLSEQPLAKVVFEEFIKRTSTRDLIIPLIPQFSDLYVYDIKIKKFKYKKFDVDIEFNSFWISIRDIIIEIDFKWTLSNLMDVFQDSGIGRIALGTLFEEDENFFTINYNSSQANSTRFDFGLNIRLSDGDIKVETIKPRIKLQQLGLQLQDRRDILKSFQYIAHLIYNLVHKRVISMLETNFASEVTHIVQEEYYKVRQFKVQLPSYFKVNHFLLFKLQESTIQGNTVVFNIENEVESDMRSVLTTCSSSIWNEKIESYEASLKVYKCLPNFLAHHIAKEFERFELSFDELALTTTVFRDFVKSIPMNVMNQPIRSVVKITETPLFAFQKPNQMLMMIKFDMNIISRRLLSTLERKILKIYTVALLTFNVSTFETLDIILDSIKIDPVELKFSDLGTVNLIDFSILTNTLLNSDSTLMKALRRRLSLNIPFKIPFIDNKKIEIYVNEDYIQAGIREWKSEDSLKDLTRVNKEDHTRVNKEDHTRVNKEDNSRFNKEDNSKDNSDNVLII
jgi:hypothetical protein